MAWISTPLSGRNKEEPTQMTAQDCAVKSGRQTALPNALEHGALFAVCLRFPSCDGIFSGPSPQGARLAEDG